MADTIFQDFISDNDTQQLLDQLRDKLNTYQTQLDTVRPAQQSQPEEYTQWIEKVKSLRGRKLFFPCLASGMGNGTFVELSDGSVKFDFIIGIGVHYLGHSDPDLTRAVLEASLEDTVMQGNLQQNEESIRLMKDMLDVANGHGAQLDHCFLTSSGAMANENGLKMCFHNRPEADRVLAFEGGFSGRTLALAQITDKPSYRKGLPDTLEVDTVPFVGKHLSKDENDKSLRRLNQLLEKHADKYGCMMMELVQGEGGFYPADREVLIEVLELLKQHDVPVFVDEIQSFGRTTQPFAFQHFGVDEYVDVVTIGKLTQTCATLYRNEFNPEPGIISQTFTSSTTAIKASRHILNHITESDYFDDNGRISSIHDWCLEELQSLHSQHPGLIDGPYGLGAMVAFTVFDGSKERTKDFLHRLFENGVIGFLAGEEPTRVRFLIPAGSITREQISEAFDIVEETLLEVAE